MHIKTPVRRCGGMTPRFMAIVDANDKYVVQSFPDHLDGLEMNPDNCPTYGEVSRYVDDIVKAVNSHQAMKEALEQSKDALCWMYGCVDDEGNIYEQYQDQMSVALERVEKSIDAAKKALLLANGGSTDV